MHKLLEKLDNELHKYADKEGELTGSEWKNVFEALEGRYYLLATMAMTGEDTSGNYSNKMKSPMYSERWPEYSENWGNDYSDRSRMRSGRGYSNTGYSNMGDMRQQLQSMMERMDAMERR